MITIDAVDKCRSWSAPLARSTFRPTCRLCIELVATEFNTSPESILAYGRDQQNVTLARQAAMWLAHCVTGQSYAAIGRSFRRDHKTVWTAVARVVERRCFDGKFLAVTDRLLLLFKTDGA